MPQRPPYFDDAPFPFDVVEEAPAVRTSGSVPAKAPRKPTAHAAKREGVRAAAVSAPAASLRASAANPYRSAMLAGYERRSPSAAGCITEPAAVWGRRTAGLASFESGSSGSFAGRAGASWPSLSRMNESAEPDAEAASVRPVAGNVLTVSAAVASLDAAVRGLFPHLWIGGEVCELTRSARGHCYFSLKDEKSRIACVLWAGTARMIGADFEAGSAIEVQCEAQVYGARGSLQMNVRAWRLAGRGALLEAFERLKKKLESEGLFAADHKKPIPRFVERVAVVTSANAAALHDVLRTIARRTPWMKTKLFDAPVQGEEAPAALAQALKRADRCGADVVLLVRGGGSLEDLQAFNDEGLARVIFAMTTPVITGVGHEVDTTIADYVADLRASTPTAAAEHLGEDLAAWLDRLSGAEQAMLLGLDRAVSDAANRTARAASSLSSSMSRELRNGMERLDRAQALLPSPAAYAAKKAAELCLAAARWDNAAAHLLERRRETLEREADALEASTVRILQHAQERLSRSAPFFATPQGFLAAPRARLDAASLRLARAVRDRLASAAEALTAQEASLDRQTSAALSRATASISRAARLQSNPENMIGAARRRLALLEQFWSSQDPAALLARGYARIRTSSGYVVRLDMLSPGEEISIELQGGTASAKVESLHPALSKEASSSTDRRDGNIS